MFEQLSLEREFRKTERMLAGGNDFSKWILRGTVALVAFCVLIGGSIAGFSFLSNRFTYVGNAEVNQLMLSPFNHTLNDGGPLTPIGLLNGTSSSYNFSVLNRFRGSIPYQVHFGLVLDNAVITNVSGVLIQYRVVPNGTHNDFFDNATFPIIWTIEGPNMASGLTPIFTAVNLPNDAGEQDFRAEITVTFYFTNALLDNLYHMDLQLVAPPS